MRAGVRIQLAALRIEGVTELARQRGHAGREHLKAPAGELVVEVRARQTSNLVAYSDQDLRSRLQARVQRVPVCVACSGRLFRQARHDPRSSIGGPNRGKFP